AAAQAPGTMGQGSGGQGTMSHQQGAREHLSAQDKQFVERAAADGFAEVDSGRVALENSQQDSIKQFAQRMVDDHTKVNDQLAQIAQSKGLTVPQHPDKPHQQAIKKLQGLHGQEFDRQYIADQIRDHNTSIKLFDT